MTGNKKPLWKKWWFWLIIIIVLIGVGNNSNNAPTKINSGNESLSEEKKDEVFSIRDEIKFNNNILIVNNVEKSSGKEFDKPKDGYEFVIVDVTIKNGGSNEIDYNPYHFELQNSKGEITNTTFTTIDSSTALHYGSLVAGGETSGTIAFEAPIDDSGLILRYKSNFFNNTEVKVKLN